MEIAINVKIGSAQFIMLNEKFILDATAGLRKMHSDSKNPYVLFIDNREIVNPDVIADFRDLSAFSNRKFKLIIFDPPHLLSNWQPKKEGNPFVKYYGLLTPETWQSDLQKGFEECWKLLDDWGVLLFKWSNHDKPAEQVLSCFPVKPIISEVTKHNPLSKHPNCKNSRYGANSTIWFIFMKIPEVSI